MLFLDFQKAFDRVCHQRLKLKLQCALKNEQILRWLDSYLTNRTQYVRIGNSFSSPAPVLSGVPQGSVLGPLLFLIYLNDLSFDSPVRCRFFADDCIVYHNIQSPHDQTAIQDYLNAIDNWCQSWRMNLNASKCTQMMITRKKAPSICTYKINNVAIRTVDKFKYLGVVIDSKLTWNAHVQYVVSASLRKLWLIKHRLKHCTSRTKLAAYTTLIRPLLEYADAVWDPHTKTGVNNIESVQKKALRFIYNIYNRRVSITDLRTRSGLPSLEFRRRLHRLQTLFNIVNKQTKMDPDIYINFNKTRETRRKHSKTIVMPPTKTTAYRFSFFPRTIAEWNALPQEVACMSSVESFVSAVQSLQ